MGSDGWDEPPLDIQIPDDARELDRDVLAYHRELRAERRRRRLRRLAGPLAGNGTIMPLVASILAVCLAAGAMLSVATFSPAPGVRTAHTHPAATASGTQSRPAAPRASQAASGTASQTAGAAASPSGHRATSSASPSPARPRPSAPSARTSGAPRGQQTPR